MLKHLFTANRRRQQPRRSPPPARPDAAHPLVRVTRAPHRERDRLPPWRSGRWSSTSSGLSWTGARASPTRSGRAGCRAIPTSWPTRGAPATGRSSPRSTTARGPWGNFDELHLATLDDLLAERGVELSRRRRGASSWRRGTAWTPGPTSAPASRRCARERPVAMLSNGHVALLVDLARHGDLRFDCVLSAELARPTSRRPRPTAPPRACSASRPAELMLVAAHPWDLEGARAAGLRTAFVDRPLEYGPGSPARADPDADEAVGDLLELAERLGG